MAPNRHHQAHPSRSSRGCEGDSRGGGRAGRFLARVDAHLPVLAGDDARRAFIDGQIEGWERRYARFVASEGAAEMATDRADPPQAADFMLTIAGLAARREALGEAETEANMAQENMAQAKEPLGKAILALLVAADQRCPAIIGQAHLLYHTGLGAGSINADRAIAQLKRDAVDLYQAIANVETEMNAAGRLQSG